MSLQRRENDTLAASAIVIQLVALDRYPELVNDDRPIGKVRGAVPGRKPWEEDLDPEFQHADPAVVVVGAGHNGLSIAARLCRLGVRTLVLEQNPRVGDNWRTRYRNLALHDPVGLDDLPYLPLRVPSFTPATKFADLL